MNEPMSCAMVGNASPLVFCLPTGSAVSLYHIDLSGVLLHRPSLCYSQQERFKNAHATGGLALYFSAVTLDTGTVCQDPDPTTERLPSRLDVFRQRATGSCS